MAITDQNTCLVLGAGVSAPFGLPLGGSLIDDIRKQISSETSKMLGPNSDRFPYLCGQAARRVEIFNEFPIIGSVLHPKAKENGTFDDPHEPANAIGRLQDLHALLENQTSETIDDFIVENPSYGSLVKLCIAVKFLKNKYSFEDKSKFQIKDFSARHLKFGSKSRPERNWVHLLINIARHSIRSGKTSNKNKIKIITFNYDCILEYVLDRQFSNTESSYGSFRDYIDILHVHGACGELKERISDPAAICNKWASGICVVNEASALGSVETARKRAAEIIRKSDEIYFCGFSFSGPNCRLLELDPKNYAGSRYARTLSVCNYDGNVGISKAIEKHRGPARIKTGLLQTEVDEDRGTPERPISVSDWFKLGSLGELPG